MKATPRPDGLCAVPGCTNRFDSRGYCRSHAARDRRYGDPLAGGPYISKQPGALQCQAQGCTQSPRAKAGKGGQFCREHLHRLERYGDPLALGPGKTEPDSIEQTCTACGDAKPVTEFGPLKQGQHGRNSQCRACEAAESRSRRASRTPEQRRRTAESKRRWQIKHDYGPDGLLVWDRILRGDGCDVCGRRTPRMAIDHCHETRVVRGLLCKDCNLVLGWMNDDPARLRGLAAYLERGAESHGHVPDRPEEKLGGSGGRPAALHKGSRARVPA